MCSNTDIGQFVVFYTIVRNIDETMIEIKLVQNKIIIYVFSITMYYLFTTFQININTGYNFK